MKEKSINYFNNIIMPFIREKHSDILDEMSFQIEGSVGLGIDDELSDLEAAKSRGAKYRLMRYTDYLFCTINLFGMTRRTE